MKMLFWIAVWIGRPFGGIRPRRLVHWLAQKAYGNCKPERSEFRVYRDRYGNRLLLHPHFFIDYQIIALGVYDSPLHRLLRQLVKPGATCLDVGANIGSVTINLMQMAGETGRVFAFEPVPHLFEKLRENVALNPHSSGVSLHQLALSRETGHAKIDVATEGYTNQGMASLHNEESPRLSHAIDIKTMTLDDFVDEYHLSRIDLIKMDTQGAEPWIIAGGRTALMRFKPSLVLEVSPRDLCSFGRTPADLLKAVEDLGYRCYHVSERGEITTPIRAADTAADFAAGEVFCRFEGLIGTK